MVVSYVRFYRFSYRILTKNGKKKPTLQLNVWSGRMCGRGKNDDVFW